MPPRTVGSIPLDGRRKIGRSLVRNAYTAPATVDHRLRQECLNQYWFTSLEDAKIEIEAWRTDYNEHRPHTSLGNQTTEQFEAEWSLPRTSKEGIF
jgi:transposase InsO family protein